MIDLILGDCKQQMAQQPDEVIDTVITDPPYGLSSPPDIVEVLEHWMRGDTYVHDGKGFMNKEWDSFVPGPEYWREAYRILKPGGYLVCFAGTRTWDMMGIAIRMAGFEIRDTILVWVQAKGFPKSLNISKALDQAAGAKRTVIGRNSNSRENATIDNSLYEPGTVGKTAYITEAATPEAEKWEGWGTALKPAWEPIILARKPFRGTLISNIRRYGVGGLNIDACRTSVGTLVGGGGNPGSEVPSGHANGRWPANFILCHTDDCEIMGTKTVKADGHFPKNTGTASMWSAESGGGGLKGLDQEEYFIKEEVVEKWKCAEGCPVAEVDRQSGIRKSGYAKVLRRSSAKFGGVYADFKGSDEMDATYGDSGGTSRFFFITKSSRKERELGCEHLPSRTGAEATDREEGTAGLDNPRAGAGRTARSVHNFHPTVKPIDLMRYLVKLTTPKGGIVLDPFMGSGTTGCAAIMEGFDFMGMEMEPDYMAIAEARIAYWSRVAANAPG